MKGTRKVYIHTFGCQMNVHDSEKIGLFLQQKGYQLTDDPQYAHVAIINTCSVREKAEQKAFSLLGRFSILKRKKPDLLILTVGCMARNMKEKIFNRIPAVDIIVGPGEIHRIPSLIDKYLEKGERIVAVEDTNHIFTLPPQQMQLPGHHHAWVTVMEGCNNFCAYCIVPYVRGRERSRSASDILSEIEYLASNGIREVTLLGQNVNSYSGVPGGFPRLLEMVNGIDELKRIRFTTSHPKDMTPDLISAVADLNKVCEFLHFPAQSGSSRILKLMNRGYGREEYLRKVELIRKTISNVALSTDILVGFPGETDEDYAETIRLLDEVKFHNVFVFHYSYRPYTSAGKMKETVEKKEKFRRVEEIVQMQRKISLHQNRQIIGTDVEIMVDGPARRGREVFVGRTRQNRVVNARGSAISGTLIQVPIRSATPNCLYAYQLDE